MSKFFKSKFFVVLVILVLAMVIIPTTLTAMGLGLPVRNAVNNLLVPIQKLFSNCAEDLKGYSEYFTEFDALKEENAQLKEKLNDIQDDVYAAEKTESTNEWLYDYLQLKRERSDFELQDANVTGRETGNYMTIFTLDKGTTSGIEKDMPVITDTGIVGYITEAGSNWSKALTILESSSAVGAYIEKTGELGVVEGDYTLSSQGLCKMIYISADSEVAEGDRILTSGYGSIYPSDLVIGYVNSVEADPYSQSLIATITPAQDMSSISKLMVVTSYEKTSQ